MTPSLTCSTSQFKSVVRCEFAQRPIGMPRPTSHGSIGNENRCPPASDKHASHLGETSPQLCCPFGLGTAIVALGKVAVSADFVAFEMSNVEFQPLQPQPMVLDVVVNPWVRRRSNHSSYAGVGKRQPTRIAEFDLSRQRLRRKPARQHSTAVSALETRSGHRLSSSSSGARSRSFRTSVRTADESR